MKSLHYIVAIALPFLFATQANADRYNSDFSMTLVKTSDVVSFDIASDLSGAQTPNVLSELEWTDMSVWSVEANANFGLGKSFKIGVRAGVGAVLDGAARDRDFLGDNRTGVFSDAIATVDGKHRVYGDINVGWEFSNSFEIPIMKVGTSGKSLAVASSIAVTPRVGFSYFRHEIQFEDGVQLIPDLGPFEGLNSSYTTEWQGVYAGVDGSFRLAGPVYLLVSARFYPDLRMRADAGWNLRADLQHPVSFRHSADGTGFSYEAGFEWQFGPLKSISLSYGESRLDAENGFAQVYSIDYGDLFTRLNNANWESKGLFLEFRWRFGA